MGAFFTRFIQEHFDPDGRLERYTYTYDDNFNYGYDVVDQLGALYPDRPAMLWRNDQGAARTLTFGEVARLSTQAAVLFQKRGLKKGDVLLCALRSHWEFWIAAVAAHKLGLILAPVYYRLTEEDFYYRLHKAKVKAVLCCREGGCAEALGAAADRAGVPLRFALGGGDGFEDFHAALQGQPETMARVETQAEEPILLYFTSGTTGEPKGVLHDHAYLLANHCGAAYMQDTHDGSRHFATGDSGWEVVAGTKFYCQWLHLGTLLVYDYDRFPAQQVLEFLQEVRATGVMAQPTVYRMLTDVGLDRYDLSSVSCFAVGGEKLPPDLAEIVEGQTGQPLYEGYAQSEAGLIAANSKNMGRKKGSVGKILPKYHVELLKDDGSFAAPGEEGEIVLLAQNGKRPVGLTMGYLDDPEGTQAIWNGEIFHTGDLAVKDEDDFLYYRGRSDGMIKSKGYRVSPVELEGILCQHPAVAECLVEGIPDRELGEKIVASVKVARGHLPTAELAEELMAFHNSQCAGFKKIRGISFVNALARNANGKLVRKRKEQ